jgi:hypothetical protein
MEKKLINDLLGKELHTLNLGLESMADALEQQDVAVDRVNWQPPARVVPRRRCWLAWVLPGM